MYNHKFFQSLSESPCDYAQFYDILLQTPWLVIKCSGCYASPFSHFCWKLELNTIFKKKSHKSLSHYQTAVNMGQLPATQNAVMRSCGVAIGTLKLGCKFLLEICLCFPKQAVVSQGLPVENLNSWKIRHINTEEKSTCFTC